MTRRDIRDRIFKIVFTLEFNDAEGMQDQLDFAFDPEMPGDEEDDPLLYGIVSNGPSLGRPVQPYSSLMR